MKSHEILKVISEVKQENTSEILTVLEDIYPDIVWFYEEETLLITFPLPENRKHTVLIYENKLVGGPRTYSISARIGEAEGVIKKLGELNLYNSVYPYGALIRENELVKVYISLLKSITNSRSLIYSAYLLAVQADTLEKLCFTADIN